MEWLEFGRAKTIHLVVRYWMDIGFENTQQDCGVLEVRICWRWWLHPPPSIMSFNIPLWGVGLLAL